MVSLGWIRSNHENLPIFVKNRIREIKKNVSTEVWHYCKSADNPADIITRYKHREILSDLWWRGPKFLRDKNLQFEDADEVSYKIEDPPALEFSTNSEVNVMITNLVNENSIEKIIDLENYNDVLKLFRVTAYVLLFIHNCKRRKRELNVEPMNTKFYLSAKYLKLAREMWIRTNQEYLLQSKEITDLRKTFMTFADEKGIFRLRSRISNSKESYDVKNPIMLDRSHRLTELLILYFHAKVYHNGVKQTLGELRATFWVSKARSLVKRILRNCVKCQRFNSRAYRYPFGASQLPAFRFDEKRPFSSVGIDYCGPLYVTPVYGNSLEKFKAFIVLYTCAATRGLVLDVVSSASSKAFIESLRRFIARRGCPQLILTDNGSVFTSTESQNFAANRFITWKFNVACAPWWGGIWERLVSCFKRCIKKVVGVRKISLVELETITLEIETILNNRPICEDFDNEIDDVLTPNHLLFGRRIESINNDDFDDEIILGSPELNRREKGLQTVLTNFWKIWRKDYVTTLRNFQQIVPKTPKINLGDIVIVHDEKIPRQFWKLGRVIEIIKGPDEVIRAAKIMVAKTGLAISRPLNRLYPIEIRGNEGRTEEKEMLTDVYEKHTEVDDDELLKNAPNLNIAQQSEDNDIESSSNTRPKRNAAIMADFKRRNVTAS